MLSLREAASLPEDTPHPRQKVFSEIWGTYWIVVECDQWCSKPKWLTCLMPGSGWTSLSLWSTGVGCRHNKTIGYTILEYHQMYTPQPAVWYGHQLFALYSLLERGNHTRSWVKALASAGERELKEALDALEPLLRGKLAGWSISFKLNPPYGPYFGVASWYTLCIIWKTRSHWFQLFKPYLSVTKPCRTRDKKHQEQTKGCIVQLQWFGLES